MAKKQTAKQAKFRPPPKKEKAAPAAPKKKAAPKKPVEAPAPKPAAPVEPPPAATKPEAPKDAQVIAHEKQQAEPPTPALARKLMHEVKVGDTVCYFADVDDRWEVVALNGVWLRAKKGSKDGTQEQCFLTDTMIPLELAQRLPRWKEQQATSALVPAGAGARKPRAKKGGTAPKPAGEQSDSTPAAPKQPKPRAPRAPKVASTATEAQKKAAVKYCEQQREEHGVCEAVRSTVHKFPTFTRDDIIEVAAAVNINRSTASTQYGIAHSST